MFSDCDFFSLSDFGENSFVFDIVGDNFIFNPDDMVLTIDPGDAVIGLMPGEMVLGLVCGLGSLRNILSLRLTFHSSRYKAFSGVLPSSCTRNRKYKYSD